MAVDGDAPKLGAVAPILRDNFWLAVHVVTIMTGYASAAIALILGNIALGYYLLGRYTSNTAATQPRAAVLHVPARACAVLAGFTYTAIQITVLLLAAGTILGALWADKAWGRFWAWDPKEVWALISLLVYLGFLHTRHIGWLGAFGMAMTAVLGAGAVGFTWYGVNFLLGSGMHSYGSGRRAVAGRHGRGRHWLFLLPPGCGINEGLGARGEAWHFKRRRRVGFLSIPTSLSFCLTFRHARAGPGIGPAARRSRPICCALRAVPDRTPRAWSPTTRADSRARSFNAGRCSI